MGELYKLEFPNGKSYIGWTRHTAAKRFKTHVGKAKAGSGYAVHAAIKKFGADAVVVKTLVVANDDYLLALEPKVIEAYGTMVPAGYNLSRGGEFPCMTEETKAKIANSHTGMRKTWLDGNQFCKGKSPSKETREKISKRQLGNKNCLGRKLTKEEIANLLGNKRALGMTHTQSSSAKAAIGAATKARMQDPAAREKLSLAKKKFWADWRLKIENN